MLKLTGVLWYNTSAGLLIGDGDYQYHTTILWYLQIVSLYCKLAHARYLEVYAYEIYEIYSIDTIKTI